MLTVHALVAAHPNYPRFAHDLANAFLTPGVGVLWVLVEKVKALGDLQEVKLANKVQMNHGTGASLVKTLANASPSIGKLAIH